MTRIVEAEAADCADVGWAKGAEEFLDGSLVGRDGVGTGRAGRAKNVASDDAGKFGGQNVGTRWGKNGFTIVDV